MLGKLSIRNFTPQTTKKGKQVTQRKISQLTGELQELQIKYERLVRPARSPEGRYVVEVRYSRQQGTSVIQLNTPESPGFERVSRDALDKQLTALKEEKGAEGLYVKVIIPEKSGLTFNEAWGFTNRLHRLYDYYFQEESAPGLIPEPVQTN